MAQVIAVSSSFERSTAAQKKFRETVVLVHHYGGNRHSFSRHTAWLNKLGFDVVTFDLPARNLRTLTRLPLSRNGHISLRHLWADKIEDVLGSLSGEKFVLSFSFPSVAVAMALGRRHAIDVRAWVSEAGPFKNVNEGIEKLLANEAWHDTISDTYSGAADSKPWQLFRSSIDKFNAANLLLQKFMALAFGIVNYDRDVDDALKKLPKGFSVLSLRDEKDTMIRPAMIDECFAADFSTVDIQRFSLPNSGHLQGFRSDSEIYKKVVSSFLTERATPI